MSLERTTSFQRGEYVCAANKFMLCVSVIIFMCTYQCVPQLQPSSADAYQAFVCDRPAVEQLSMFSLYLVMLKTLSCVSSSHAFSVIKFTIFLLSVIVLVWWHWKAVRFCVALLCLQDIVRGFSLHFWCSVPSGSIVFMVVSSCLWWAVCSRPKPRCCEFVFKFLVIIVLSNLYCHH